MRYPASELGSVVRVGCADVDCCSHSTLGAVGQQRFTAHLPKIEGAGTFTVCAFATVGSQIGVGLVGVNGV